MLEDFECDAICHSRINDSSALLWKEEQKEECPTEMIEHKTLLAWATKKHHCSDGIMVTMKRVFELISMNFTAVTMRTVIVMLTLICGLSGHQLIHDEQ